MWSRAPQDLGRKSLVRWENTKVGRLGYCCPYRGVHFVW